MNTRQQIFLATLLYRTAMKSSSWLYWEKERFSDQKQLQTWYYGKNSITMELDPMKNCKAILMLQFNLSFDILSASTPIPNIHSTTSNIERF